MDTHFESDSDSDPDAEVRNTIRISVLKYQRPLTNPLVTRRFTRHSVRLPAAPRTTATLPLAGCPYLMRSPSLPLSLAGVRSTGRLRGQVDEEDKWSRRTTLEHGGLSAPSSFDFVAASAAEPFAPPTNSQRTRRPSSSSFSRPPHPCLFLACVPPDEGCTQ